MEIVGGVIKTNELTENASGGSELVARRLASSIDPTFLKETQIINGRVRELDPTKIRILLIHDLPGDPECEHLRNDGWKKFHRIVFVSNWQMQQFCGYYQIPWEACTVIRNAVDPIERSDDYSKLKIIYHTTPHRGLDILVDVWDELHEDFPKFELDVYSSFKLYGWAQRDEPYEKLFARIKEHPAMNYHGFAPNEEVRSALSRSHVFAYPSMWLETSCICLMEAMSAGLICVHPNLGALYETADVYTSMYQWSPDKQTHKKIFKEKLEIALSFVSDHDPEHALEMVSEQRTRMDRYFNWDYRIQEWNMLIASMLDLPREVPKDEPMFVYRS